MQGAGITAIGGSVHVLDLGQPGGPASDEVLIAVKAAGVGNWDDLVRTGQWNVGATPPMALGVEAAGVIEAVGDEVTNLAPGDEVMTHPLPLRQQGTWADKLIAPAVLIARKPRNASWESAAAFPVPALTAEQVLGETLQVRKGEWVLVHGAGGVTGGVIVQLAVAKGAVVIATASSASAERLRRYGAMAVLDHHNAEWPTKVRELTDSGAGVSAAVNAARGEAKVALQAVARGGRLATITGDPPQTERGITAWNVYVRPDGAQLDALAESFAAGQISIHVATTYPIEDAAVALAAAVSGGVGGAAVLVMRESN